jgi:hypothetical protein
VCGCGALVNHADPLIAAHGLDEECSTVRLPAYTTSWQHAGPLLEEMAADEDVELHVTLSGIFHVRVIFPLGPADAYYDRFDPEAVARAWLAWQEARACEKP